MTFNRTEMSEKLLSTLREEALYTERLKQDKDVFMALRKESVDFYFKGAKIFGFSEKGFRSHKKFCVNADTEDDYIVQNDLPGIKIITDPIINYDRVKENAGNYAGVESTGTAYLYPQDWTSQKNPFLLDIEIALYDDKGKDKIDLLLYDQDKRMLKFIEAKDFSNPELWSAKETKPKVVDQIARYNRRLEDDGVYETILAEYRRYVGILNGFYQTDIPEPESIDRNVGLYIFGFDKDQRDNRLKELLFDDGSLEGIMYYAKGGASGIDGSTLVKETLSR